jgi:hypothetical protein
MAIEAEQGSRNVSATGNIAYASCVYLIRKKVRGEQSVYMRSRKSQNSKLKTEFSVSCTKSEAGIAALGAPPDDAQGAGEANS